MLLSDDDIDDCDGAAAAARDNDNIIMITLSSLVSVSFYFTILVNVRNTELHAWDRVTYTFYITLT